MSTEEQAKQERAMKRMELFNAVYIQTAPLIPKCTGNIAAQRARNALKEFDCAFPEQERQK